MNNETMQLLYNRKSVRAYEKQPIPEADVQAILRAAVEAPTAGNMTLWSAIRVTDEAKKKRLSETCDNQPFIAAAPLVLVFCADYKRWYDLFASLELGETLRRPGEGDMMLAMVDAVIAAHASVVAADALGYGISSSAASSSGRFSAFRPTSCRCAWRFTAFRRNSSGSARSPRALMCAISFSKTSISRAARRKCGACLRRGRISTGRNWSSGSRRAASASGTANFPRR